MNGKKMDVVRNNNVRFDPTRKLTPQEVAEPYAFIVKQEVGTGFMEVLYGHDIRNFETLEKAQDTLFTKIQEFRKSQQIDNRTNEIVVVYAKNKLQMSLQGILPPQLDVWAEKTGVPEE
jgi:hypothetical protein